MAMTFELHPIASVSRLGESASLRRIGRLPAERGWVTEPDCEKDCDRYGCLRLTMQACICSRSKHPRCGRPLDTKEPLPLHCPLPASEL